MLLSIFGTFATCGVGGRQVTETPKWHATPTNQFQANVPDSIGSMWAYVLHGRALGATNSEIAR